jgi:glutamate/tyrosine decarboxylase-like PLP-dependent enzyme
VGFPREAGGILLSGGSAANFVALAAMREARLPGTRQRGLRGLDRAPVIYVTAETHSCIRRAVDLLGLGDDALRLLPTDDAFRMDPRALAVAIREDRGAGRLPLCVVGTAGTVNTGAVDPLSRIRDIARAEDLWFHVDGAYGAVGAALPELAAHYEGMADADSLTVDPHKWLYVPYEAGGLLVKDRNALTRAFATKAAYLEVADTDYFSGPLWFHQQGPQLSRAFRALKVWAVMREIGLEGYRALWRHDLAGGRAAPAGGRAPAPRADGTLELEHRLFPLRAARGRHQPAQPAAGGSDPAGRPDLRVGDDRGRLRLPPRGHPQLPEWVGRFADGGGGGGRAGGLSRRRVSRTYRLADFKFT